VRRIYISLWVCAVAFISSCEVYYFDPGFLCPLVVAACPARTDLIVRALEPSELRALQRRMCRQGKTCLAFMNDERGREIGSVCRSARSSIIARDRWETIYLSKFTDFSLVQTPQPRKYHSMICSQSVASTPRVVQPCVWIVSMVLQPSQIAHRVLTAPKHCRQRQVIDLQCRDTRHQVHSSHLPLV
jgi:hypothetical protein